MSSSKTAKNVDRVNSLGKHGWMIVLSSFLLYLLGCAVVTDLLNVSVTAISEAHTGLNATLMLSASTVAGWIALVAAIFSGSLVQKFGPRKVMTVSTLIFSIAVFLMGMVTANWEYIVLVIVIGITDATQSGMAMQTVIARWFPRKKGIAMGWATIGLLASTIAFLPFFNAMLAAIGIVKSYWVVGVISLAVCIYNYAVIRDVPEELGIAPDNDPTTNPEELQKEADQIVQYMSSSPWTIGKLLKTKEVWMISMMLGCGMMVATGVLSQFVGRMATYGVSSGVAVSLMSLTAIVGIPCSYLWGLMDAKFGPKKPTTAMLSLYLVAVLLLLAVGGNIAGSIVALLVFYAALGGIPNMLTSYTTTVFGRYDFQSANRIMYPIYNVVRCCAFAIVAISTALFNGSFTVTYILLAICLAAAIVVSIIVKDTCIGRKDLE